MIVHIPKDIWVRMVVRFATVIWVLLVIMHAYGDHEVTLHALVLEVWVTVQDCDVIHVNEVRVLNVHAIILEVLVLVVRVLVSTLFQDAVDGMSSCRPGTN